MSPVKEMLRTGTVRLVRRNHLTQSELHSMYRLLCDYFEGVTLAQFSQDLAGKNWVILIESAERIVGFSTLLAYETLVDGEICSVIYSGDTIVAKEAWRSSALSRGWIESVAKLRELYPRGRYLWLLITSGFRTYRFLPLFWRDFFPRFDQSTPADWKRLTDSLATERFHHSYDPATGLVRFENPQRLRGSLAEIPAGRKADPHIDFFASCNPRHMQGDELVCITELSPQNLTPAGRRMATALPQW